VRAMLTAAASAWEAQHLPTVSAVTAVAVSREAVTVPPLLPWSDPAVPELLQEELLHRFVARHSSSRCTAKTAAGVAAAGGADITSTAATVSSNGDSVSALAAAAATIAQLSRTDEQRL
jgi:hypothetical protein